LSSRQLLVAIDSIDNRIADKVKSNSANADKYLYFLNKERLEAKKEENRAKKEADFKRQQKELEKFKQDKATQEVVQEDKKEVAKKSIPIVKNKTPKPKDRVNPKNQSKQKKNDPKKSNHSKKGRTSIKPINQTIDQPLVKYESIAETFEKSKLAKLFDKAKTSARSIFSSTESTMKSLDRIKENRVKHVFELHYKFSMALACFIFLFVGAPMGAIVKKGGFGFPLLISIIFFVIFVMLTIFSKNIAERFVINAVLAAWIPCLVVFPIGLLLTWVAMTDASLPNFKSLFAQLQEKLNREKDDFSAKSLKGS